MLSILIDVSLTVIFVVVATNTPESYNFIIKDSTPSVILSASISMLNNALLFIIDITPLTVETSLLMIVPVAA